MRRPGPRSFTNLPSWAKQQNFYRIRCGNSIPVSPGGVLRDKVIHGYIGVDYELLWETIDKKIPVVIRSLRQILNESN